MFQPPWLLPEARVILPLTGHQAPVMSSLAQQQAFVGRPEWVLLAPED